MSNIHQLPSMTDLGADDEIPVFQIENGSTRKATVADIAVRVAELIEGAPDETQYSLDADGGAFALLVVPLAQGGNVWAQIDLSAQAASGTITLPVGVDRGHGQEVLVTVSKAVTALLVAGSGAAVNGAPTSLVAHGFFRMRYDSVGNAWYRVG